jgi:nucleotide-binding universal stress UspA family protein
MPTHGRRPLAQALLGRAASEVVHSGVAPVLLVKPVPN